MRQTGVVFFLSLLLLSLLVAGAAQPTAATEPPTWTALQKGLDLAETTFDESPQETPQRIAVLRIDPERYDFTLHMASADQPRSPSELVAREGLVAAVNAGMYLPDGRTSIGYMRDAAHVNNPRVAGKLGAFFVAGPLRGGLPRAALLDREADDWQSALNAYSLVVQGYRLTDTHGAVLWPEGGAAHRIAALGQDTDGRILFLFGRDPMSPAAFARGAHALPLKLRSLMYLEGGNPAAMLVRAGGAEAGWSGNRLGMFFGGNESTNAPLPNILGLKARASSPTQQ